VRRLEGENLFLRQQLSQQLNIALRQASIDADHLDTRATVAAGAPWQLGLAST